MSQFDEKEFLRTVTQRPGVYRMFNDQEEVIYVGKAKNLKNRLTSYFRKNLDSPKTRALVANIHDIQVTVTNTETEAFILENNFIKKYLPKYNVLLRDDKSYPFIFISAHRHPKVGLHRGSQKAKGSYFGPYPNSSAVRESLRLIQKAFPVRQCEDSYYNARSRPCLQYQLKRCSAPCVDKVTDEEYDEQVDLLKAFLKGKDQYVTSQLTEKMEQASQSLHFELAARFRDQIIALRKVQEQQWVSGDSKDMDVMALSYEGGTACVHVLFVREGKVLGSKNFFPKVPKSTESEELLRSFLLQFYLAGNKSVPSQIVIPFKLEELEQILPLLEEQRQGKVALLFNVRSERKKYLDLATTNARIALTTRNNERASFESKFSQLETLLDLSQPIQRVECFDISHTSGQQTVASCVVFNREGPFKSDYRRYNISGITPGDDFAAMAKALEKRYTSKTDQGKIPDILFIDGGKGQLAQAEQYFADAEGRVPILIGVAKGTSRKPGLETLIMAGNHEVIPLESDNQALHLIQHVRDESHRFAVAGHRAKREKVKRTSTLESIPGVGGKRRQALLKHFGGLQEILKAGVDDLSSVNGISREMAQKIHDYLHDK